MKKIIVFKEDESRKIEELIRVLEKNDKSSEITRIKNNRSALIELARSVSLYPSILKEQHLGSATRSVETLVESMCQNDKTEESDIRLNIPTKALLGNSFLIAKMNFFYMLYYLTEELAEVESIKRSIKTFISNNVFTLMAEDVFLSIIDDCEISIDIRMSAGYLLANIWEYRLYHGVKKFAPILSDIWKAREALVPAYGTMLGFSELFRISEQIEPAFLDFIQRDELSDEEIASIEEFIFGLSYEETSRIRSEMDEQGQWVLSKAEIEKIIGQNWVYPEYHVRDQRELYRSFLHRKINAKNRARARIDGPHKTIEEYIMCYLLPISKE